MGGWQERVRSRAGGRGHALGARAAAGVRGATLLRREDVAAAAPGVGREFHLGLLGGAVFLMAFQMNAVAPLLPVLAGEFGVPAARVGLLIPAFALPYGVVALGYGPLSDRVGRRRVLGLCLGVLATALFGARLSPTMGGLLTLRIAAGLGAGGIMPVALAYIADLYPYHERGRAIGVLYAALTGGMAAGFSLGPALAAWAGWRALFGGQAVLAAAVFALFQFSPAPAAGPPSSPPSQGAGYRAVLALGRARRAYALMVLAGLCVFGTTAWFGMYAHASYGLDSVSIGLAYLAYGIVGGLSPVMGALADRLGRALLVPAGLAATTLGALLLASQGPLALAILGLAGVALGHQMTTPLLAGLITELVPHARGRAMGLNSFVLFMGVGGGSLLVGALVPAGFGVAFSGVALLAAASALVASRFLRGER